MSITIKNNNDIYYIDYEKITELIIDLYNNNTFDYDYLKKFINLRKLKIYKCNINYISDNLINLEELEIYNCNKIKEIPDTLINLKKYI